MHDIDGHHRHSPPPHMGREWGNADGYPFAITNSNTIMHQSDDSQFRFRTSGHLRYISRGTPGHIQSIAGSNARMVMCEDEQL